MPAFKKERTTSQTTVSKAESSSPPMPEQQAFQEHLHALAQSAVRAVIELVMREELDAFIGAAWGESSPNRKGYRNGSYTRDLVTSTGSLAEIKVPRDRAGQFHTQVFDRYSRYEPQVAEAAHRDVCGRSQHTQSGGSGPNADGSGSKSRARSVASTRRSPSNMKLGDSVPFRTTGAFCTWMACISAFVMGKKPIPRSF